MGLVPHIAILAFGAIVILAAVIFVAADMFGRVDYLKEKVPWLNRILERRGAIAVLLLVTVFLLTGDVFELVIKEVPDVPLPPIVVIKPPPTPIIQQQRESQPRTLKDNHIIPATIPEVEVDEQEEIPSTRNTKFALRVTIKANKTIQPVHLRLQCDGPLIDADLQEPVRLVQFSYGVVPDQTNIA